MTKGKDNNSDEFKQYIHQMISSDALIQPFVQLDGHTLHAQDLDHSYWVDVFTSLYSRFDRYIKGGAEVISFKEDFYLKGKKQHIHWFYHYFGLYIYYI